MNFLEVKSTEKIFIKHYSKRRMSDKNSLGFLARMEVFNHWPTPVFLIQFCFIFSPQCHVCMTWGQGTCFGVFATLHPKSVCALPPGCRFTGWFLLALCFLWVRSQGYYSRSANQAVTSTSKIYYSPLLQEKGARAQVGRRGEPGRDTLHPLSLL